MIHNMGGISEEELQFIQQQQHLHDGVIVHNHGEQNSTLVNEVNENTIENTTEENLNVETVEEIDENEEVDEEVDDEEEVDNEEEVDDDEEVDDEEEVEYEEIDDEEVEDEEVEYDVSSQESLEETNLVNSKEEIQQLIKDYYYKKTNSELKELLKIYHKSTKGNKINLVNRVLEIEEYNNIDLNLLTN